jgi:hypothetical protein
MNILKDDLKKSKRLIFYKLTNDEYSFLNNVSSMTFIKFNQLKKMFMGLLIYFYLYRALDSNKFELVIPFFGKLIFDIDELKEKVNFPFQLENEDIEINLKLKISPSLNDIVKSHIDNKSTWLEDLFLITIRRNLEDKLL